MSESDSDDIVYYVSRRNSSNAVYHQSETCPRLATARNPIPIDREIIEDERDECQFCSGSMENKGGTRSHFKSLLKAAEDSS